MDRGGVRLAGWLLSGFVGASVLTLAQDETDHPSPLISQGQVTIEGKQTPYLIRRLPVSSFPDLPEKVAAELNRRGCMIPQTYEAHHPENVVHASLAMTGSSDWAVLCAVQGTASLLVFFDGADDGQPVVLASAAETRRLQAHDASGVMGFNWGIDPVTPQKVHEAQSGLTPRPARVDHDALAESILNGKTVYHFYAKSAWSVLPMPD